LDDGGDSNGGLYGCWGASWAGNGRDCDPSCGDATQRTVGDGSGARGDGYEGGLVDDFADGGGGCEHGGVVCERAVCDGGGAGGDGVVVCGEDCGGEGCVWGCCVGVCGVGCGCGCGEC